MKIKQSWQKTAYGTGFSFLNLMAPLLIPLSWCYGIINLIRRKCYQKGFIKSNIIDVPVISIGNITVGGVGKTPFTIFLAQHLEKLGKHPAILMRGYGRKSEDFYILTAENFIPKKIDFYGDEAALISFNAHIPVGIGADRSVVARQLLEQIQCDCLILDDGFQHLALKRDKDILVFDGQNPFGNGYTLPYGPLREFTKTIKKADVFVFNGDINQQVKDFSSSTNSFAGHLQWLDIQPFLEWYNHSGNQLTPIQDFMGKQVILLSGIGSPTRLENQAKDYGLKVIQHVSFPDHYWFDAEDLRKHIDDQPEFNILMTEKDAIRFVPILYEIEQWWDYFFVIRSEWQMNDEIAFNHWIKENILPLNQPPQT